MSNPSRGNPNAFAANPSGVTGGARQRDAASAAAAAARAAKQSSSSASLSAGGSAARAPAPALPIGVALDEARRLALGADTSSSGILAAARASIAARASSAALAAARPAAACRASQPSYAAAAAAAPAAASAPAASSRGRAAAVPAAHLHALASAHALRARALAAASPASRLPAAGALRVVERPTFIQRGAPLPSRELLIVPHASCNTGGSTLLFSWIDEKGAGNCFYHCGVRRLYGNDSRHRELRAQICTHMEMPENWRRFADFAAVRYDGPAYGAVHRALFFAYMQEHRRAAYADEPQQQAFRSARRARRSRRAQSNLTIRRVTSTSGLPRPMHQRTFTCHCTSVGTSAQPPPLDCTLARGRRAQRSARWQLEPSARATRLIRPDLLLAACCVRGKTFTCHCHLSTQCTDCVCICRRQHVGRPVTDAIATHSLWSDRMSPRDSGASRRRWELRRSH